MLNWTAADAMRQRTSKDSENTADRFHEGKEHSHKANDASMSSVLEMDALRTQTDKK